MILFDAVFVNNGGAKILLDLLLNDLNKSNTEIFYLLDKRVKGSYNFLKNEKVIYISGSLISRHLFYLKNATKFRKVFVFGNIPPTIYLQNSQVYTYFHNVLLLEKIYWYKYSKIFLNLKSFIFKYFKKNTNFWLVQTNLVKRNLKQCLTINDAEILLYPIFNENYFFNNKVRNTIPKDGIIKYLYVSEGYFYKGHINLIKAFIKYNDLYPDTNLILTVSDKYYNHLDSFTHVKQKKFIINKGFLNQYELKQEYEKANIFIFPSFFESFGLGLIEAALSKLPILASDLEYVFEVIQPTLVFNPTIIDDIYFALIKSREHIGEYSPLLIKNNLKNITKLILE
jgi:glycosyltransferase involved in cell wall biosynthesis